MDDHLTEWREAKDAVLAVEPKPWVAKACELAGDEFDDAAWRERPGQPERFVEFYQEAGGPVVFDPPLD